MLWQEVGSKGINNSFYEKKVRLQTPKAVFVTRFLLWKNIVWLLTCVVGKRRRRSALKYAKKCILGKSRAKHQISTFLNYFPRRMWRILFQKMLISAFEQNLEKKWLFTPPNFRVCARWKVPAKRFKICHILCLRKPKVAFSIFHFVIVPFFLMNALV